MALQLERVLHLKADTCDLERRAYKTDVEVALKTQMGDLAALIDSKTERADLVVGRV